LFGDKVKKLLTKIKPFYQRRPGLPKDLEDEIISVVVPVMKKYAIMKRKHMTKDRIAGIAREAIWKASVILWYGKI